MLKFIRKLKFTGSILFLALLLCLERTQASAYNSPKKYFQYVETEDELRKIVSEKSKENSSFIQFNKAITLTQDLTVAANHQLISYTPDCVLTINPGITLVINPNATLDLPLVNYGSFQNFGLSGNKETINYGNFSNYAYFFARGSFQNFGTVLNKNNSFKDIESSLAFCLVSSEGEKTNKFYNYGVFINESSFRIEDNLLYNYGLFINNGLLSIWSKTSSTLGKIYGNPLTGKYTKATTLNLYDNYDGSHNILQEIFSKSPAHFYADPFFNAFGKNGMRFLGWNEKADGTGRSYSETLLLEQDFELYAQWSPKAPLFYDISLGPEQLFSQTSWNSCRVFLDRNASLSKLNPSINLAEGVTVSPALDKPQDFSTPVSYQFETADGQRYDFNISAEQAPAIPKILNESLPPIKPEEYYFAEIEIAAEKESNATVLLESNPDLGLFISPGRPYLLEGRIPTGTDSIDITLSVYSVPYGQKSSRSYQLTLQQDGLLHTAPKTGDALVPKAFILTLIALPAILLPLALVLKRKKP